MCYVLEMHIAGIYDHLIRNERQSLHVEYIFLNDDMNEQPLMYVSPFDWLLAIHIIYTTTKTWLRYHKTHICYQVSIRLMSSMCRPHYKLNYQHMQKFNPYAARTEYMRFQANFIPNKLNSSSENVL